MICIRTGINVPLDSPYRDEINTAILKLKEERVIKNIRDKWWIKENTPIIDGVPTNCTEDKVDNEGTLDWSHVYGIYYILLYGILFSILVGITEFLWNIRKISIEQKVQRNIFWKSSV